MQCRHKLELSLITEIYFAYSHFDDPQTDSSKHIHTPQKRGEDSK